MIASTTSWIFFVLLNAYYSGALTMFFTTEIRVPFNSIEEVMKAYPDWKLKFMSGNDVFFQYKAIQVSYAPSPIKYAPYIVSNNYCIYFQGDPLSVSYTHLTLPTILLV